MKRTILILSSVLFSGCAFHRTTEITYNPETKANDKTTFTGIVWFQKTGIEGLTVGKRSGSSSTTLSLSKGATETQSEAIKAIAAGATEGAIKGATKALIP